MGFMMKQSGSWVDASTVYKKVNGAWVEQTDLASVVPDNVRYQNGGEYVLQTRTVTVTGTGEKTYCYLTINGKKVYSAGVYHITSGDEIECFLDALFSSVILNGEKVMSEPGTYTYPVTSDCSIALSGSSNIAAKIEITTQ